MIGNYLDENDVILFVPMSIIFYVDTIFFFFFLTLSVILYLDSFKVICSQHCPLYIQIIRLK